MKRFLTFLGVLIASHALSNLSFGADNRIWLASQMDWGAKRGFYLDFENSCPDGNPCGLENLRLILGVGNGENWRFLEPHPAYPWRYDRVYVATAEIGPSGASLTLDGRLIEGDRLPWKTAAVPLEANSIPGWARAPAEYLIVQESLRLDSPGGKPLDLSFIPFAGLPLPLLLFDSQDPRRVESWRVGADQTVRLRAAFRLVRRPGSLQALSPFLDRYGQAVAARWSGKVRSDDDLKRARQAEEKDLSRWKRPKNLDPYGGSKSAGWRSKPTGFYAVAKRNDFWWLITPDGNPCFYTGLCTAPALDWDKTPVSDREFLFDSLPPRTGSTAAAWGKDPWGRNPGTDYLALHTVNMIRKYGPRWREIEKDLTLRRLRAWGFSGFGKWCDRLPKTPSLPVLNRGGVPNVARHPDVFDPEIRKRFREALRKQIEPARKDPFIVGWSLGNEYDEIVNADEIREILKKPATTAAKRALIDEAIRNSYAGSPAQAAKAAGLSEETKEALYAAPVNFPDKIMESLRRFYADRYYDFIYRTVKSVDPNHLYLGFWIVPDWWVSEEDWRLIARHCDVIGYDHYSYDFADAPLLRLIQETGKPILCGEFSFPAHYHGERGYGVYPSAVETDADAGAAYRRWTQSAAGHPNCIGIAWFQYRDEPLTGRGPGRGPNLVYGEDYAFGLTDVTDRPKNDLIEPLRKANLSAISWRMEAMKMSQFAD
jgi:hypothetical protein